MSATLHSFTATPESSGSVAPVPGAVVAVYRTHADAEQGVRALEAAGFDMKALSIVGKDYTTAEGVVGYYTAGERMKVWGKAGAFWGGLWGLLFGSALFVVPGVGPLFVAGPLVAWMVGALEGAVVVGGLSVVGAGLASLGIPKNSIITYETAIKAGRFVLIAHGTPAQVERARGTLAPVMHDTLEAHPSLFL